MMTPSRNITSSGSLLLRLRRRTGAQALWGLAHTGRQGHGRFWIVLEAVVGALRRCASSLVFLLARLCFAGSSDVCRARQAGELSVHASAAACSGPADMAQAFLAGRVEGH